MSHINFPQAYESIISTSAKMPEWLRVATADYPHQRMSEQRENQHVIKHDNRTFEVTFNSGATQILYGYHRSEVNGDFVQFFGEGQNIVGFRSDTVSSYRMVPPQEVPVVPKNSYKIVLVSDEATLEVRADMYRTIQVGDQQFYEFLSRVSDYQSREELTILTDSVRYVCRVEVDAAQEPTGNQIKVSDKAKQFLRDGLAQEDYIEAVRPKKG